MLFLDIVITNSCDKLVIYDIPYRIIYHVKSIHKICIAILYLIATTLLLFNEQQGFYVGANRIIDKGNPTKILTCNRSNDEVDATSS